MNYSSNDPYLFCDEIYCMGLKKETGRKERAIAQFREIDIKVVWVEAIKARPPRLGCLKTHQAIIRMAKEAGHKNVLIFENDIKFLYQKEKTRYNFLRGLWDLPEDYHALYLGIRWGTPGEHVSKSIVNVVSGKTTHAVMFSSTIFDTIINSKAKNFDHCMLDDIQPQGKCYCIQPILAIQYG